MAGVHDRFLRKELAAWAKRFPDEFYQQIFRLQGWEWKGMSINRPQAVGHYTKDIVYARLAPASCRSWNSATRRTRRAAAGASTTSG